MAEEIPSEYSAFYKKTTKRPKGILFILSLLVILLIGVFVGLRFFSVDSLIASLSGESKKTTPTPSKMEVKVELTKIPEPTGTPTEEPSVTGASKKTTPTPTTSKTSGSSKIDRSTLVVDVQNGSGISGAARKVSATLTKAGYTIGRVGNADSFDYTGVTIQVKSTKGNYLEQLKKDLATDYTVSSATKDLPSSSTADALVIYGKDE